MPLPSRDSPSLQRIDHAERFFAATGADIRHGSNQAFYTVASDFVQMPPFETFRDTESYYVTLAHECTHWTRHPSRLERDIGCKRWGDESFAAEELVAEPGSAFLCAAFDLTPEPLPDHAAHIASWLKVLKDDKCAIVTAAAMPRGPRTLSMECSRPRRRSAWHRRLRHSHQTGMALFFSAPVIDAIITPGPRPLRAADATPAYDICPQGRSGQEATQAMLISGQNRMSRIASCLEAAHHFLLSEPEAIALADDIRGGVTA